MAKASSVAFLASALVVLAIAGSAHCRKAVVKKDVGKGFVFKTSGYAVCDPCRLPFHPPTQIQYPLPGSDVGLYCENPKTWAEVSKVVTTNKDGFFEISLSGVHDGDNCIVHINHTPDKGCSFHAPSGIDRHQIDNVNENSTGWSGELVLWPDSISKKCNQTERKVMLKLAGL